MSVTVEKGHTTFIIDPHKIVYTARPNINPPKIILGNYCSVASNCSFVFDSHLVDRCISSQKYTTNKTNNDIHIGHDVWIGGNCTILGGIQIGNGAVVGAGAIVTENVPPYSIVAGNPARVIKYRFSEELIRRLEILNFWEMPKTVIESYDRWTSDISGFIEKVEKDRLTSTKSKIVDCFLFHNELDLLKYRLRVLDEHVDFFVLVESTHTFTGIEKPCIFNDNKELFTQYKDKIIHVLVDDMPYKNSSDNVLDNVEFQWNYIKRGLQKLTLGDEDIILISDVDEIPDMKCICDKIAGGMKKEIHNLEQDMYFYNKTKKIHDKWYFSKIMSFKKYCEMDMPIHTLRQTEASDTIHKAGWRLAYFGDKHCIQNKIRNASSSEVDIDTIQDKIDHSIDVIYGKKLSVIPLEFNTYLPIYHDLL